MGETKPPRVFTFEQMHRFAPTAGPWGPMLRVFADCGLRLGEVLGLERGDFATPSVPAARLRPAGSPSGTSRPRSTSGRFHAAFDGRADSRPAPEDRHAAAVPHTDRPAVARVELQARGVEPARKASGRNIRRHDCRHSWVTQLRAAVHAQPGSSPVRLDDVLQIRVAREKMYEAQDALKRVAGLSPRRPMDEVIGNGCQP